MAFAGFALLAVIVLGVVFLVGRSDLDEVRAATKQFNHVEAAVTVIRCFTLFLD